MAHSFFKGAHFQLKEMFTLAYHNSVRVGITFSSTHKLSVNLLQMLQLNFCNLLEINILKDSNRYHLEFRVWLGFTYKENQGKKHQSWVKDYVKHGSTEMPHSPDVFRQWTLKHSRNFSQWGTWKLKTNIDFVPSILSIIHIYIYVIYTYGDML